MLHVKRHTVVTPLTNGLLIFLLAVSTGFAGVRRAQASANPPPPTTRPSMTTARLPTTTAHMPPASPQRPSAPTHLAPDSTLAYSPTSLEQTVSLGNIFTQTLTLTATGSEAIDLTLSSYTTLLDRVYGIYATATDPHVAYFNRATPETLTDLGIFANGSPGGDFVGGDFSKVYAIANNDDVWSSVDDSLVTINTQTGITTSIGLLGAPPGFETYGAMAYDPLTNQLYAISSYVDFFGTGGNTLYTIDLATGQANAVGPIVSPSPRDIGSLAFDGAGHLYALDQWSLELVQINLNPLGFTAIGVLDVFPEFNTGMDWDPATNQMYLSMWRNIEGGELRLVDLATAQTTLVGSLGSTVPGSTEIGFTWIAFASEAAPWLTATPNQITVPANGTTTVEVALDTRVLYQLGDYAGYLAFNGVFSNSVVSMPITLHVNCAACGTLTGNFTDAWTLAPLNAQLHATSAAGMDVHLPPGATSYSATVPTGVYTLTASAPGYLNETRVVTATNGGTTTTDIALLPQASLIEVDTTPIDVTATIGDIATRTVTVSNTGTIPMTFTVRMDNLDVPLSVRNATLSALRGEHVFAPQDVLEINAYGINHPGFLIGGELAWFDLANPTELFTGSVYHDHGSMVGGDFFGDDFSRLYGAEESKLIALDTATGAKTTIGPLPQISPYDSYDGMAYDPTSGAMYILNEYDCFNPPTTLYQVNVETAAVTTVGDLPSGFGCMGDIAFDDTGHLYAVDIDNNTIVEIDPTTLAVTTIGGVGFDIPTFEHGLAWDSATNQMYFTVVDISTGFPYIEKLYLVDLFTGHATYLNVIGTVMPGAGLAYPAGLAIQSETIRWADLPTNTLSIPAGMSATFDVVFDTRSIYRTGDYLSDLTFNGTFINAAPEVPVALHLSCATCGAVAGNITAVETASPLPANVHLTNANGFDVTLFNKTAYSLTVLPGAYTATVMSPGYVSVSAVITVAENGTTTTNFALVKDEPVISLSSLVGLRF